MILSGCGDGPPADSAEAFHQAIQDGNVGTVRATVKAHPDWLRKVGKKGLVPLEMAVKAQQGEVLAQLIASGADVNAVNQFGQTVLDVAVANRQGPEMIELLRKHGGQQKTSGDKSTK
jgi:ankyrin repeat protein